MRIACSGTLAVAAFNWINGVMRSLGNSTIPLIFLIIACALNIGLDLLFVIGFDMGVAGAAYATIIAQAVSAAGCIVRRCLKALHIPLFVPAGLLEKGRGDPSRRYTGRIHDGLHRGINHPDLAGKVMEIGHGGIGKLLFI